MAFDYATRQVWLGHFTVSVQPGAAYPMCDGHAGRMTPPLGWTLTDGRRSGGVAVVALEVA
jgi:hypothetical protein